MLRDEGCKKGGVIGVLSGSNADLAFPRRVGELFVCKRCEIGVFSDIEDARAERQREPVAVRVAEVRRHGLFERCRVDGLRHALIDEVDEVADIDGHQDVGRRIGAFCCNSFRQALLDKDGIHGDAGFGGKGLEQRLDQSGLSRGVDVDVGKRRRGQERGGSESKRELPLYRQRHTDFSSDRDGSKAVRWGCRPW